MTTPQDQLPPPPPPAGRGWMLAPIALACVAGAAWWFWPSQGASLGPTPADGTPSAQAGETGASGTKPTMPEQSQARDAILNSAAAVRTTEPAKAEAILRAGVREHPGEQALHAALADLLMATGRAPEAYEQFEKALASGERTVDLEFSAGLAASVARRDDRAIEHFSAAQRLSPSDPKAALFLAQAQVRSNRLDEAKTSLLFAVNLDPELALAWGTLAEIALRENRTRLAAQHIARAREIEPRVTVWRVLQARIRNREGDAAGALDLLAPLTDAERLEPGVLQTMAESYGLLDRPLDAADALARASDRDPSNATWPLEAARWYQRARQPDKARIYAQRAATLGAPGADALIASLDGAAPTPPPSAGVPTPGGG